MTEFKRQLYLKDDDIKVFLEEINEQMFIHVTIYNMSKAVLTKMRKIWGEIVIKLYYEGYEGLFTYTKDHRMVNLIGGAEKIGEHAGYEVYRWDLS